MMTISLCYTSPNFNIIFTPNSFLQSSMIPIPKGARANLSNSDMYRSIAISSLMGKILDNVLIERQSCSLATSNNNSVLKLSHLLFCVVLWSLKLYNIIRKKIVNQYIYCYWMHLRSPMICYLNY